MKIGIKTRWRQYERICKIYGLGHFSAITDDQERAARMKGRHQPWEKKNGHNVVLARPNLMQAVRALTEMCEGID